MDPIIKVRWIKALTSGDYVQGTKCLRSADDKFCCLGVLTDLYAKENSMDWKPSENNSLIYSICDKPHYYLDNNIKEWAGLTDNNPDVIYQSENINLANLNDDLELSFKEIAEIIKEQL